VRREEDPAVAGITQSAAKGSSENWRLRKPGKERRGRSHDIGAVDVAQATAVVSDGAVRRAAALAAREVRSADVSETWGRRLPAKKMGVRSARDVR
jgi:hypothetical protein